MQNQHRTGFTAWEHLLRFLIDLINSGWIRLIAKVTIALLVALAFVVMTLIIGFDYLGLQVRGDQIFLGKYKIGQISRTPNDPTTKVGRNHLDPDYFAQVTVEAVAGFQNSGIYLKKGDKVRLEPDGRIHLALRQVSTLTGLGKSIIAGELPSGGKEYNNYKNLYQLRDATGQVLDLTKTNILEKVTQIGNFGQKDEFRRDWTGPDGEELDSLELNNCLLFQENSPQKGRWGMLLAQVMKKPGSAVADPFQVLEDNNLRSKDLIPVITSKDIEFDNDGWLTFIVNDAVLSGVSKAQTEGCKASHDALKKASEILRSQGDNYRIPEGLIPLIWYSDNIGAFHVTVRYADK